ncbi:hypothetical protein [uncultured Kocuria sp.]|uniref:hypothetical protein n=1 Tax=uncultured Kocuria sp. TaxID=259305 RepID=UPI002627D214|nr:hypothetical protein [uncultured Kocuria sp.]
MQKLIVGVLADPGLPEKVARRVAENLPRALSEHTGPDVSWAVEVSRETLPLTADGDIPLLDKAGGLRAEHGWDYVVYLTDLPRAHQGDPLLCEVGAAAAAALVSLPALGADHFSRKACGLLVALVGALRDGVEGHISTAAVHEALGRRAVRRVSPAGDGDVSYLVLPGRMNQVRLLTGMVLSNRPGRLLPALASCVAAAAATGAFGIFYASIWSMSDALSPARLAMISVVVTGALSGWLIFHNGLWNRSPQDDEPWRAGSDNASTVITVWLSVALMYVLLWTMLFLVGLAVIEAGYLESQLGHPVTLLDYLDLSWLAASLGTLAGALGSNFDSDEAIREATYSRREHQRRQLADSYDD